MRSGATHHVKVLCLVFLASVACAQDGQSTPKFTFEVATVKPSARDANGRVLAMRIVDGPGTSDPGRITYANLTLQQLLLTAYEVAPYQLSAPPGLDSDSVRFVIQGT